jgi:hypothetical protein
MPASTLLGPLERASLNHWTQSTIILPEDGIGSSFRNVVFYRNIGLWTKSKNIILLTMVYSNYNYCDSGLCPSSNI